MAFLIWELVWRLSFVKAILNKQYKRSKKRESKQWSLERLSLKKGFILLMDKAEMNIAVFASGTGSNFHAIVQDQHLRKNVKLLVCDQPGAKVIETAKVYNVPSFVFSSKDFINKEAYEQRISEKLRQKDINFIVLAGYMRIVGETLFATYAGKMFNIPPSYLPDWPGKDGVGQAIRAKLRRTAVTIR